MGHLSIVTQETIKDVIKEGYISTRGKLKKKITEVIASMFADVLAVRKGDIVFPWIVSDEKSGNLGFKYIFYVSGPPIFVKGNKYPIKIPLKKYGYEFRIPLSEAEALNLWRKKLLWNIIGKKSLGKGKSFMHQLPMEDELMLDLLKSKNIENPRKIKLGHRSFKSIPLSINPSQKEWKNKLKKRLEVTPEEKKISKIELRNLPWRKKSKNQFIVEKALEAWLMENLDKPKCKNLIKLILPNSKIKWFGSYLPFGVQGSNIDIVIIHLKNKKTVITVIELKVNSLNLKEFEKAAEQSVTYSIFLKEAFEAFGIKVKLNPVVLSGLPKRGVKIQNIKALKKGLSLKWISYSINDNGIIKFGKIL
jgi:hypothetical protein